MKKYIIIYGFLFAVALIHTGQYYGLMPGTVVSKFDFSGHPIGMMGRDLFFGIYLGVMALITGTFLAQGYFIPRLSDSKINIPNKDYWLAPERREKTLTGMRNLILQFGIVSQIFMIAVMNAVLEANLSKQEVHLANTTLFPILIGFVAYVIGWSIFLVAKHLRVPAQR